MLHLLKEKQMIIVAAFLLGGCKNIQESNFSEAPLDRVQEDLSIVQNNDPAIQNTGALSVESPQLKDALDRMLVGLNVTVASKTSKYGLDLKDDGTLLVREGDSLSKIVQSIAGDSQINPDFLQKVFIEANPRAFKRKNPNWLYAGARLKIPDIDDFRKVIFRQSYMSDKKPTSFDPTSDWIRYPPVAPK